MASKLQPLKIVIAALGGEGGGVLAKWIVDIAERTGYIAQYTSIPGVAQRTGATTYYIELFPSDGGALSPVMALTPSPGDVDIVIASELLEVGRAIEKGLVTPGKTTLIGSTHRTYAVSEKSVMTDNRYDSDQIINAAKDFSAHLILQDLKAVSDQAGSIINAVFFGALASTGRLGADVQMFEAVIRDGGKAVKSNLAGFSAGMDLQAGAAKEALNPEINTEKTAGSLSDFPDEVHEILRLGKIRTTGYQSGKYTDLFVERFRRILAADKAAGDGKTYQLSNEVGRYLALRMTYEDVLRVADLKTGADRLGDIRAKSGGPQDIVEILDYFKPGIEEIRAVLPPFLSAALKPFEAPVFNRPFKGGITIKTTSVTGFYTLKALAKLKWWRPHSARFKAEQQNIETWLAQVIELAGKDYDLALEYTECANLLKGYGDTYRQGLTNFDAITSLLPNLQQRSGGAADLKSLRKAALSDPEGASLEQAIKSAGLQV